MKFPYKGAALVLSALAVLYSPRVWANPCTFTTTQDILTCALRNHPDIIDAQTAIDRDQALQTIAKARPNPELESKVVSGSADGQTVIDSETSLFHILELGGKRRARVEQAIAQGQLTSVAQLEIKERVALTTVLSLYRLNQIQNELSLVQESLSTFDHIFRQFKSRPLLPPEQEVSLSVFELATEDYKLKKTELLSEKQDLESFLEIATGSSFLAMERLLPKEKREWPFPGTSTAFASADIKKAESELGLSEATLNLAKRNAWPDFKIGPTIETQNQSDDTVLTAGASLSIPLPILNRNQGEKEYAALDRVRVSTALRAVQAKTAAEREKQVKRYQSAVASLSQAKSRGNLNEKHHEVERFFEKGLVPSSLVIESHRQIFDITKSLHTQELTARDALWRLYIIDGRALEERL